MHFLGLVLDWKDVNENGINPRSMKLSDVSLYRICNSDRRSAVLIAIPLRLVVITRLHSYSHVLLRDLVLR